MFVAARRLLIDVELTARARLVVSVHPPGPAGEPVRRVVRDPAAHHHFELDGLAADTAYRVTMRPDSAPWGVERFPVRTAKRHEDQAARDMVRGVLPGFVGLTATVAAMYEARRFTSERDLAQALGGTQLSEQEFTRALDLALEWNSEELLRVLAANVHGEAHTYTRLQLARAAARLGLEDPLRVFDARAREPALLVDDPRLVAAYFEALSASLPDASRFATLSREIERIAPHPSPGVAACLVGADRDGAARLFTRWRKGTNPYLAQLALIGLAQLSTAPAIDELGRALASPRSPGDADVAASLLGDVEGEEPRRLLLAAADRSPVSTDVVWSLGLTGGPEVAQPLVRLLRDPRAGVRAAAACALGLAGARGASPELVRTLGESDPAVSRAAAFALGRLRSIESRQALREYTSSDRDEDGVGAWALGEVAGEAAEPELLALVRDQVSRRSVLRAGMAVLAVGLRSAAARARLLERFKDQPEASIKDALSAVRTIDQYSMARAHVVFPFVPRDRTGVQAKPGEVYRCLPVERWCSRDGGGLLPGRPGSLDHLGSKLEPVLFAPGILRFAHEPRPLLVTRACELQLAPVDRHHHLVASSLRTDSLAGVAIVFISRMAPQP